MTTILKNSAPPMVGRDEGSARRRALKLRKGPGRLTRTTRREWTLMLWASAVTHAREFLIRAQHATGSDQAHDLKSAREWGEMARKYYAQGTGKGRRAAA